MKSGRVHLGARTAKRFHSIRESLWLRPVLFAAGALTLGLVLPAVDERLFQPGGTFAGFFRRIIPSLSAAEALLSTGVGALTTLLGVVFSLTVVTLQLAAVQYTSRVLRRFMSDPFTQTMLGVFLGANLYLVLTLSAIRQDPGGKEHVPPISTLVAILLMLVSSGVLAFFLHHLARSIQASTVIAGIGKDTLRAFQKLGITESEGERSEDIPGEQEGGCVLRATAPGYLMLVDEDALIEAAPEGCTVLRIEARTGDFLLPGVPLLKMWPARELSREDRQRLSRCFAQGSERTLHQDVLFGIRQLVDIALRALSPGVNDVTTGLMAINELGAVGHAVATGRGGGGGGYRCTRLEKLRLLIPLMGMEDFLAGAFGELPRAAQDQPRLLVRMLEILAQLSDASDDAEVKRLLQACADRMVVIAHAGSLTKPELEPVQRAREAIGRPAQVDSGPHQETT